VAVSVAVINHSTVSMFMCC